MLFLFVGSIYHSWFSLSYTDDEENGRQWTGPGLLRLSFDPC